MNSIRVMSSVWNYLFCPQTSFHRETSGGVVKCRLFVWPKTPHKQVKVGCLYLELFPSFNCLWGGGGGGVGGWRRGGIYIFRKVALLYEGTLNLQRFTNTTSLSQGLLSRIVVVQ